MYASQPWRWGAGWREPVLLEHTKREGVRQWLRGPLVAWGDKGGSRYKSKSSSP